MSQVSADKSIQDLKHRAALSRLLAITALMIAIIAAVAGATTEGGMWVRIVAFSVCGMFANIAITRTITASVYTSSTVLAALEEKR